MTVVIPDLLFFKIRDKLVNGFICQPITTSLEKPNFGARASRAYEAKIIVVREGQALFEAEYPKEPLLNVPFERCFIEFNPPIIANNFDKNEERRPEFQQIKEDLHKIGGVYFSTLPPNNDPYMGFWFNPEGNFILLDIQFGKGENTGLKQKSIVVKARSITTLTENLLTFLNCRNVHLKPEGTSRKHNKKLILQGQSPIPPPYYICHVDIPKFIYKKELKSGVRRIFNYRFDVRGHFRSLVSPKWTHKRGQMIWIPPYVKGSGEYIPKTYEFAERKENTEKET